MSIRERTWETKGVQKTAWIVDYYAQTGKRHIKTFSKKKDALAFEAKARIEVNGKVHVADSATVTVAEAAKYWLASCAELERSTVAQYTQHVNLHVVPFIGKKKLNEITIPAVRTFLDNLAANGRSAAMVRAVRVSLGALLSDAQERGLVVQNAVKDLGRKKGKAQAAARHKEQVQVGVDIPMPAEVRAMLAAANGKPRVFLMTAILTGMRASELRGLRWTDLDLDKATVTIRQRADAYHEIGSPKSSKGRRTIPLPADLVKALKEWQKDCPAGALGLVFPSGTGKIEFYANITKRWFYPAQLAAGVTIDTGGKDAKGNPILEPKYSGLHALRHFYASWLINRPEDGGLGLPPKIVQDRMGHSSIQVTLDTYSHLFPKGDDAGAMDNAAAALLV
ncbi:site-specific integrase [Mesorhizobium tamadayense]|uniref:Site-specific integrase n=1 Tax=Mesorhizobium tamadayense TaxID=425306 RepID=A0A3P3EUG7_9HYPH|nr:site-specific integrase [Mesorhizobium tamadayense]RRH90050.1 site-specific integrase [Mesorhizobium tamadayense]